MKATLELVGRQKLREMASWFEIHFADSHDRRQVRAGRVEWAIEVYAGKEGQGAGCAALVLLAFGASLGAFAIRLMASVPWSSGGFR